MPLNHHKKATPLQFTSPPTGSRPAKCKREVGKVYGDCMSEWWNETLDLKGVVPPEHYKAFKHQQMSCAMRAWKVSKNRGKCE